MICALLTPIGWNEEHGRYEDSLEKEKFYRMDGRHGEGCRLLVRVMQFVEVFVKEWRVENPVAPVRQIILSCRIYFFFKFAIIFDLSLIKKEEQNSPARWKWLAIGEQPRRIRNLRNRSRWMFSRRSWWNRRWFPKGRSQRKAKVIREGFRVSPIRVRATWWVDISIPQAGHVGGRNSTSAGIRPHPSRWHTRWSWRAKCNKAVPPICNPWAKSRRKESVPLTTMCCLFRPLVRCEGIW